MKEKVPYVNLETVKDSDGNIEKFVIRTVTYLPADSKVTGSGEGKVADSVLYRPLTISYTGTSTEYDYFGIDFTINREDVGLLERGSKIIVKATVNSSAKLMTANLCDPDDEEDPTTTVEYDDPIMP